MNEDVLEQFGLTKNEAKVYLALLRSGLSTVGDVAEKSRVHRTNVYDVIERLIEKGLVCYIMKEGAKCYEATAPENLMNVLKEKEIQLQKILPTLMLDKKLAEKKSEAHVYEGIAAVKMLLNHFLDFDEPRYVYGIPKDAISEMDVFIKHYHERRIKKKQVMKHIYNEDAKERIKYLNSLPYTEARYLPKEFDSPVATNVCGNEVIFIHWGVKPPLVIQIISKELADQYKKYFELLWKIAR